MKPASRDDSVSRREFVRSTSTLAAVALTGGISPSALATIGASALPAVVSNRRHPLLTPADRFRDVSRGEPKPWSLAGDALLRARLTPETWRLEITSVDTAGPGINEPARLHKPRTIDAGTALDLPALMELGRRHEVKFLKAMQCLNIPNPLGQGLWEGVPLRDVLRLCGPMRDVRRIYYGGFHNRDPKQVFQSSLSYTQAMETPPGELPAFLAYRLNGEPIPLMRGGPVRMVIPWAHGFKSIKWLQHIVVTNDYRANDTYAEQNNDPESHLKTAAYLDDVPAKISAGHPLAIGGLVISGLSGLKRVEYAIERGDAPSSASGDGEPGSWIPCRLEDPPEDWSKELPADVSTRSVMGFDPKTGQPATWPLRYTMISWSAKIKGLKPGRHSLRVRAVDLNGFAQPEPRPEQKSGRNVDEPKEFEVY